MSDKHRSSLPKGLEVIHGRKAIDVVEREAGDLVELYYEQANVFSGIAGIFGVKRVEVDHDQICAPL